MHEECLDPIKERARWVAFERGQARLNFWFGFWIGIFVGMTLTCVLFSFGFFSGR